MQHLHTWTCLGESGGESPYKQVGTKENCPGIVLGTKEHITKSRIHKIIIYPQSLITKIPKSGGQEGEGGLLRLVVMIQEANRPHSKNSLSCLLCSSAAISSPGPDLAKPGPPPPPWNRMGLSPTPCFLPHLYARNPVCFLVAHFARVFVYSFRSVLPGSVMPERHARLLALLVPQETAAAQSPAHSARIQITQHGMLQPSPAAAHMEHAQARFVSNRLSFIKRGASFCLHHSRFPAVPSGSAPGTLRWSGAVVWWNGIFSRWFGCLTAVT